MQKITNYCDKCGAETNKIVQLRLDLKGYVTIPPMAQSTAEWECSCNGAIWFHADLCPQCAAEIAGLFFDEPDTVTVNE